VATLKAALAGSGSPENSGTFYARSYSWDTSILPKRMNYIPKDHIHKVCLIGGGEKCCAYLVSIIGGIACAKGTQGAYDIELELAKGTRTAKGDNCRGSHTKLWSKKWKATMNAIKFQFKLWILGWAYLIEGFLRVITLGAAYGKFVLPVSKWVARHRPEGR